MWIPFQIFTYQIKASKSRFLFIYQKSNQWNLRPQLRHWVLNHANCPKTATQSKKNKEASINYSLARTSKPQRLSMKKSSRKEKLLKTLNLNPWELWTIKFQNSKAQVLKVTYIVKHPGQLSIWELEQDYAKNTLCQAITLVGPIVMKCLRSITFHRGPQPYTNLLLTPQMTSFLLISHQI